MRKLVAFAAVVCLVAFLGSGVWPETTVSQHARPAAAGDKVLTIPACAFDEMEDGYDFVRVNALYLSTGSGSFNTPVNLPHGSIIKKVILICWDDNGSDNIKLLRKKYDSELKWWYQNGNMDYMGRSQGFQSSGQFNGYRVYMTQQLPAIWVEDPTKVLKIVMRNPITGFSL